MNIPQQIPYIKNYAEGILLIKRYRLSVLILCVVDGNSCGDFEGLCFFCAFLVNALFYF